MKMNNFYKGKKVFVTGHTGFKGSWLCSVLLELGAEVEGYALRPGTKPSLFELINLGSKLNSVIGDVRNLELLQKTMLDFKPEIVIHLAAQPIVRESYNNPVYTYETNVMGSVNILESVRHCNSVASVLNVTTDKVYKNNEWCYGYRESDILDGFDPYSNSKSCSELVTASYKRSFFENRMAVSTARAGNVIGGGDYAKDRVIPDCVSYVKANLPILIRNPHSVRPYQHVLEPVIAYLKLSQAQYENLSLQGNYNIGPYMKDSIRTIDLVRMFCEAWGENANFTVLPNDKASVHEAGLLTLDHSKIKNVLDIEPKWSIRNAIEKVVEFEKTSAKEHSITMQIHEFLNML